MRNTNGSKPPSTHVGLFRRYSLETNANKTKTMTLFPHQTHTMMTAHAYKRRMTGHGDDHRQMKKQRVVCSVCNKSLAVSSLTNHQ